MEKARNLNFSLSPYDFGRLLLLMLFSWSFLKVTTMQRRMEFRLVIMCFITQLALYIVFLFTQADIVYLLLKFLRLFAVFFPALVFVQTTVYSSLKFEKALKALIVVSFIAISLNRIDFFELAFGYPVWFGLLIYLLPLPLILGFAMFIIFLAVKGLSKVIVV